MIRWKLCLATIAATSTLVFSGSAAAQELNCDDFDSQAEAQDFLREDPSDPEGLDGPPGDAFSGTRGVACEENPPPTDLDPVLPSGFGVPNGLPEEDEEEPPDGELSEGEPPDREPPNRPPPDSEPSDSEPPDSEPLDREPPDREPSNRPPPDREPPDEDEVLLEAGGDLPPPPQSETENETITDHRFPLWRIVGMVLSAGVFVWAVRSVFSRG